MTDQRPITDLDTRTGLPDALRVLLEQYPRDMWQAHPNFDGLTRFWMERHLMFRDLMTRLQTETRNVIDRKGDPQQIAQRSARMTGFLIDQLHGHHGIEDAHYFPQLQAMEPRLRRGFEILDADHHALDAHLQALATGTNAMLRAIAAAQGIDPRDAAGALERQLTEFETFLDRHLTDEEDLVVPVILHHGAGP